MEEETMLDSYYKEGCKYIYPQLHKEWKKVVYSVPLKGDGLQLVLRMYVEVFKDMDKNLDMNKCASNYYDLYGFDFHLEYKEMVNLYQTMFKNIVNLSKRGVEFFLFDAKRDCLESIGNLDVKFALIKLNKRNEYYKRIQKEYKNNLRNNKNYLK